MAITKQITSLADNITERGQIHVKTITRVLEDGTVISESIHRKVLNPGNSLEEEGAQVAAIAAAVWTPEVLAAWQAGNPAPMEEWRPKAIAALQKYVKDVCGILSSLLSIYSAKNEVENKAAVISAIDAVKIIQSSPGVVAAYMANPGSRAAFDAAVEARWDEIKADAPDEVKVDFVAIGGNTL